MGGHKLTCSECSATKLKARGMCAKCYQRWQAVNRPDKGPCSLCSDAAVFKGFCIKHYELQRPGHVTKPPKAPQWNFRECAIPGCPHKPTTLTTLALCDHHYERLEIWLWEQAHWDESKWNA